MRTVSALVALAACAYSQTIVDIVVSSPDHTELVKLVLAAGTGITDALVENPVTLFAPNNVGVNAAMALLGNPGPAWNASNLTQEQVAVLTPILAYHAFRANVSSADITGPTYVKSLAGPPLKVWLDGSDVTVTGSNTVTVVSPDIFATNGVVHSVNSVLLPPPALTEGAAALPSLFAAVGAINGLVDVLLGLEDLTVFAPSNDAFTTFLKEQNTTLATIDKAVLEKVLKYHCIGSRLFSPNVIAGGNTTVESLSGDKVTVTVGSTVMVDDATVISTDIMFANGVVHVINKVLMPPVDVVDGSTSAPKDDKSSATLPCLTAAAVFSMALLA